ncbi:MAG TPA: membrane dipeptidase [Bordetella sp.]|jgi:membrane dipeptidase|nr:membrane dipeptidase [Bordetella sp.]
MTTSIEISGRARALLRDHLVWDAHGGFTPKVDQDLSQLSRWEEADVDFLSINVGFDIHPWEHTIKVLAAYRHWLAQRPERFVMVEGVDDILKARQQGKLAVAFDLEGAVSLAGQVEMLALYHRLGVRQSHFVYNLNNAAGGGCHDADIGLTDFGRELVRECNRLGILIDMSHVSFSTSMDIIALSSKPVVFSHSNPLEHTNHPRNISRAQMRAVAEQGGLVGVTGVGRFLGDREASSEAFVRAIEMTVDEIGVGNVAMGLDYTWAPGGPARAPAFWPSEYYTGKFAYLGPHQLPEITELLLRRNYAERDIAAIYGENYLRIATAAWAV